MQKLFATVLPYMPLLLFLAATVMLVFIFSEYKTGKMRGQVGLTFIAVAITFVASAIAYRQQSK